MSLLSGEPDPDFQPTRRACYLRFFGMAVVGWTLAVFAIKGWLRALFDWPGVAGWWWIPFFIFTAFGVIVAGSLFIWFLVQLGKWEGPITAFISADIERLARKTPFPNACRKILQIIAALLFLPWILIFIGGPSD